MKNGASSYEELKDAFERVGQAHVFRYFDQLDESGRRRLLEQAGSIDLGELDELIRKQVLQRPAEAEGGFESLEPAPYVALPDSGGDPAEWRRAGEVGAEALRAGRVAAFTVAGGQGTRLGFEGPKGAYPVTPVTGKMLFQVFGEKIARTAERFGVTIPWIVMTSGANHAETVSLFEKHGYFGLPEGSVSFITQGLVPAVDYGGRILLEDKDSIAMTPDGHGGALRALVRSGAAADLRERGIDCISYFQVDNPLVHCVDPAFIGFHLSGGSELSSKMVPKAYPEEKVGHFCLRDGSTLEVIEYSDMPSSLQEEVDENGELRFRAGSVAIHVFDREFVERVGGAADDLSLPFHRAEKKIPCLDGEGRPVKPSEPNGIKFEMFVFDALPLARNPVVVEAARGEEFSPVKNAGGKDSPTTAREDQLRMFARWLRAAGEDVPTDSGGLPEVAFEISARFAADEADFVERWNNLREKPAIRDGLVIE